MKDTIIVSGGNIHKDFALDFLKKNKTENTCLIAADRGVEFFMGTDLEPDVAVGDFDSLSAEGAKYMETLKHTEIRRLKPGEGRFRHTVSSKLCDRTGNRTYYDPGGDRKPHRSSDGKFRSSDAWKNKTGTDRSC